MMKSRIIIALFFALLCSLPAAAQSKKLQVSIGLSVTERDAELESDLRNRLTRDLQSLGNVEIVSNGDYMIRAALIKIVPKDNSEVRYAMSYELTHWVKCQNEVYLEFLKGGMIVTDKEGLRKKLDWFVAKAFDEN